MVQLCHFYSRCHSKFSGVSHLTPVTCTRLGPFTTMVPCLCLILHLLFNTTNKDSDEMADLRTGNGILL